MFAQGGAGVLIQILDLGRYLRPRHDAEIFDHPKGKATRDRRQCVVPGQVQQRFEQCRDLAINKMLQAALHLGGDIRSGLVINECHGLRFQRVIARHQLAHGMFAPHQPALFGKVDFRIGCVIEPVCQQMELRRKGCHTGSAQGLGLVGIGGFVLRKAEPLKTANQLPFDRHFTFVVHFGHEALLLLQPAQQNGCAPVNKSLRQPRVQRVRQAIFYSASRLAPMGFVIYPAFSLRDIGPCADKRQAF